MYMFKQVKYKYRLHLQVLHAVHLQFVYRTRKSLEFNSRPGKAGKNRIMDRRSGKAGIFFSLVNKKRKKILTIKAYFFFSIKPQMLELLNI